MKKYFIPTIVVLTLLCSCTTTDISLYRIQKDGLYGFIDSTGREVIAPQYIIADRFSEGLALVVVDTTKISTRDFTGCKTFMDTLRMSLDNPVVTQYRYGYIDYRNKIIVDTSLIYSCEDIFEEFDKLRCYNSSILFQDQKTRKYGFLNSKGEVAIPAMYNDATTFSEGLAAVQDTSEKWGFVDSLGSTVIEFKFSHALEFSDGLARIAFTQEDSMGFKILHYFIDRTGTIVIGPWQPFIHRMGYFNEGLALCSYHIVECGYRFVNKQGQTLMPEYIFDDVTNFNCGYAGIKSGNNWLFVDKNINVPVEEVFDDTYGFREGYAAVKRGDLWGFVDTTFQLKIPFQFDSIHNSFDKGLACVQIDRGPIRTIAYINKDGEIKWQHQWSEWN